MNASDFFIRTYLGGASPPVGVITLRQFAYADFRCMPRGIFMPDMLQLCLNCCRYFCCNTCRYSSSDFSYCCVPAFPAIILRLLFDFRSYISISWIVSHVRGNQWERCFHLTDAASVAELAKFVTLSSHAFAKRFFFSSISFCK